MVFECPGRGGFGEEKDCQIPDRRTVQLQQTVVTLEYSRDEIREALKSRSVQFFLERSRRRMDQQVIPTVNLIPRRRKSTVAQVVPIR